MATVFTTILNMSLTASIIILVVLLARLCLKKAPKIYSYLLWVVVLFRLLCPVSLSLPVSVLAPVSEASATAGTSYTASMEYITVPQRPEPQHTQSPVQGGSPVQDENNIASVEPEQNAPAVVVEQQAKRSAGEIVLTVLGWLWAAGMAAVLGFTTWQTLALKRKLDTAFIVRGNIFESEQIDTAFILGVFNPKIYLPLDLPFDIQKAVVAHEQTHQRRGDHIVKLVSYLVLAVHWFNPLVWLSFKLMCDDMEKSCDEAVLREMNNRGYSMKSIKKAYGNMLLVLGGGKQHIFSPVSFAENSTKSRVKNVVAYNRIARNMGVGLAVVCVLVALLCVVNPTGAAAVVASDTDVTASGSEDKESAELEHDPNAVEITIGDVTFWSDVTELDLSGRRLDDISALAQCTRLESLNLSSTHITDISVLAQIPTLKRLDLSYNGNENENGFETYYDSETGTYLPYDCIDDWSALSKCKNLVFLNLSNSGVSDLSVLSSLTNLQGLDISDNYKVAVTDEPGHKSVNRTFENKEVSDALRGLRYLNLSNLSLEEISFVGSLDALEELNLSGNSIMDISVLAQIPTLKKLDLSRNVYDERNEDGDRVLYPSFGNWSVLGQCTGLVSLNISETGVTDLSFLQSLTNLQELNLSGNGIDIYSFSPEKRRRYIQTVENEAVIGTLTKLRYLNLYELGLDDISFISSLTELEELNISHNYITNLSSLNEHAKLKKLICEDNYFGFFERYESVYQPEFPYGLTALEELHVEYSYFSDFKGIADCTKMRVLYAPYDWNNIELLAEMKHLESLSISTPLEKTDNLSSLSGIKELRCLSISAFDVSGIEHLSSLENLELHEVGDISPIEKCSNLKELNLDFSYETDVDISPLSGLTQLTKLQLWGKNLTDLNGLQYLTELKELRLSGVHIVDGGSISDISPLSSLSKLAYLDLSYNNISDISPLSSLHELAYLDFSCNNVSDLSPLFGLKGLRTGTYFMESDIFIAPVIDMFENPLTEAQWNELYEALDGRAGMSGLSFSPSDDPSW